MAGPIVHPGGAIAERAGVRPGCFVIRNLARALLPAFGAVTRRPVSDSRGESGRAVGRSASRMRERRRPVVKPLAQGFHRPTMSA